MKSASPWSLLSIGWIWSGMLRQQWSFFTVELQAEEGFFNQFLLIRRSWRMSLPTPQRAFTTSGYRPSDDFIPLLDFYGNGVIRTRLVLEESAMDFVPEESTTKFDQKNILDVTLGWRPLPRSSPA
ncbi:ribosomal S17 family protein [Striga asiatica]|uniref:Ribosomal S17 family protein n=1 Tax=Striga asiatica TaxID=4170 RepID=A0A5A7R2D0_STRAF|nr:ribosomal S17 family protein [Striga asiatica]